MTTGPEANDLDREVDASMRMFEKSMVGDAATISTIKPSRVLLVLDGSSQDTAAVDAAVCLRDRFNTETLVLDARESNQPTGSSPGSETDSQQADQAPVVAKQISGARPITRKEGEAYESILASLDQHAVDLVIVPCPYGRSFDSVGVDSTGTVIDVLLSRCARPLLVIRRDDQRLQHCLQNVSMIVGGECDVEPKAAAWSLGLAGESATVTLNLVVEHEQYENIRSIVEALQPGTQLEPEQFSQALAKSHHALHGNMAKTAGELGLTYHLRPQAGEVAPPNPLRDPKEMLLVIPLEVDDRFEQGFVHDRIRRSPHPVLIVPGHVPA